uniref:Sidoreflexin n=1 Tax=Eutreptiella gymnastica TaxID=73025 RepID=A0A7S4D3Q6_9EUGL
MAFLQSYLPTFGAAKGRAKPFSSTAERYNQNTFGGRFRKMLDLTNPMHLLATKRQVLEARDRLKEYERSGCVVGVSDEELWAARSLTASAIHPDTGDLIPRPLRMSGFLVFNAPICLAAVLATSYPSILLVHWLNQTHSALINYANRNASSPLSNLDLLKSYCTAVGCAVGIAFGLATTIKTRLPPAHATAALRLVALPASMVAAGANCYMMRRHELVTGIAVRDADGNDRGTSRAAAAKAMREMVASRLVAVPPVFGAPAIVMAVPPVAALVARRPGLGLPVSFSAVLLGFGVGLPGAIAMFPQTGAICVRKMEPQFGALQDSAQPPVTELYYNKGL